MRRLPENYTINRYGLTARLVNETDAEFIVRLRTDPYHGKYIGKTDSSIDAQREWIRDYKKREEEGIDYYFVFFKDGKKIGLNRIYNIKDKTLQTGSWLFSREAPFGSAFLAQIILRELVFIDWGFEYEDDSKGGVHVDNKNVQRFNLLAGMKEIGRYTTDAGEFISLGLSKEDFLAGRKKVLHLLGVKDAYGDKE